MKNSVVIALIFGLILIAGLTLWQKTTSEDQLPTFSLQTLDGKPWQPEDYREHVLIINFWATWCPPCRKEMPLFVDLQREFEERKVTFVGIAIDNPESVRSYVENNGINFPILLGDPGGSELSQKLGNEMVGLPYTVIVARDGTIHTRHIGAINEAQLKPLLEQLTRS